MILRGNDTVMLTVRDAVESILGYPRQPDFVGSHVVDPQPVVHGYAVMDGVMWVDDDFVHAIDQIADDAIRDQAIALVAERETWTG